MIDKKYKNKENISSDLYKTITIYNKDNKLYVNFILNKKNKSYLQSDILKLLKLENESYTLKSLSAKAGATISSL